MIIEYNKNPLYSVIILDDADKKELKQKIRIHILEEMLFEGWLYLEDGTHFDLDKAKKRLKIEYEEDGETSNIDRMCEHMYDYCLAELSFIHSGDCTCVAASCGKCRVEELLGIDTIAGLGKHSANKIDNAFGKRNEKTIDEALEYLKNYHPIPENPEKWEKIGGYEQYMPRWKDEAKYAYDWLLNYKETHLTQG